VPNASFLPTRNLKPETRNDSTSQALNWIKSRAWESGILVYYREEALKRGAKAETSYLSETAASS